MEYIRNVHALNPTNGDFDSQVVAFMESSTILRTFVQPGKGSFAWHKHMSDQLYYVIEGELDIQLGSERLHAPQGSLVILPAGIPHHSSNPGTVPEFHLEIIAPTPLPTEEIALLVDDDLSYEQPAIQCIRPVDPSKFQVFPHDPGFTSQYLSRYEDGSKFGTVSIVIQQPGAGGPGKHIHEFDQFYFILDGELTLEIAGREHSAQRHDLVILPAGVPHSQSNKGGEVERHVSIATPAPIGEPRHWDRNVRFEFESLGAE